MRMHVYHVKEDEISDKMKEYEMLSYTYTF